MNTRSPTLWLALSLILNVFLIGGIVGGAYWWKLTEPRRPAPLGTQQGLRFVLQELPAAERKVFREALRETRRAAASQIETSRQGRREVLELLLAPALDRAAIDKALERTRQADIGLRALVEATVVQYASTLPPRERARLVDMLMRRGPLRQAVPTDPQP